MLSSYHDELCQFHIMLLSNDVVLNVRNRLRLSEQMSFQSTKFYFRLKSFRYSVTSVFCSFDSSPATLQPEELADLA